MKYLSITLVFFLLSEVAFGQSEAQKFKNDILLSSYYDRNELSKSFNLFNFSRLFTLTDNSEVFGFIGDNYQRLRIKFITINKTGPITYSVYGKSMVKNNICEFKGEIKISNIRKTKITSLGVDSIYKDKGIKGEYVIIGDYTFFEEKNQPQSGIFKGGFKTVFYLDKNNQIHYDDIDMQADGYTNNEFLGEWMSYASNKIKTCNWGDYRIPNSGDLDIGAGDFSPNDKYLKFGWQSFRDYGLPNQKKSKNTEETNWWK